MKSARYFSQALTKSELSRNIFTEVSNTKFHTNPFGETRADTCGDKDGQTERPIDGRT